MSDSLQWRKLSYDRPGGCIIESIDLSEAVIVKNGKILHDLWSQNSLILVRGREVLPEKEEYELCQAFYDEMNLVDECAKQNQSDDDDDVVPKSEYNELLKKLEQLEIDHFSLSSDFKDAKMTISNLQDDIEMEKTRNSDKEEQLAAFSELEEYSAGLREECGNLEEMLQDTRARYSDLEQSYTVSSILRSVHQC